MRQQLVGVCEPVDLSQAPLPLRKREPVAPASREPEIRHVISKVGCAKVLQNEVPDVVDLSSDPQTAGDTAARDAQDVMMQDEEFASSCKRELATPFQGKTGLGHASTESASVKMQLVEACGAIDLS